MDEFKNNREIQITNAIGALFASFFLILFLWWIFGSIAEITNSIQFQEVSDLSVFLLYLPAIIIVLVWFYCIFKYFKPRKYNKTMKAFAKPSSDDFETAIERNPRDLTRLFLLIGAIIAVLTIYVKDIASYGHGDGWTNLDRNSLETTISPILTTIGKDLENCSSSVKKTSDQQLQTRNYFGWENIFTSGLSCFADENVAYFQASLSTTNYNMNTFLNHEGKYYQKQKMIVYYEPFEYWFDPNDSKHFKLRFNTSKCYEIFVYNKVLLYDAKLKKFILSATQISGQTGKLFRHGCFFAHTLNFSNELGILEYDSITKQCNFIYDNWWDNFKENYKWVIYLADYLLMIIVIILLLLICKRYISVLSTIFNKLLKIKMHFPIC